MRVLLSNDDGWAAPGIGTLAATLGAAGHEVVVVAPSSERSGSGTALGCLDDGYEFALDPVQLPGTVAAFALDAPPAMCVLTALSGVLDVRADLVVSGINAGHNTGRNIIHSGTFGAAWMAARLGRPAAAVSVGPLPGGRFDTAARLVTERLSSFAQVPVGHVLNVNVPDLDYAALGAPIATSLARSGMQRVDLERRGNVVRVSERGVHPSPGDTDAVLAGRVSCTLVEARLDLGELTGALLDHPSTVSPFTDIEESLR